MKRLPPYHTYLLLEGLTSFLFSMIFTASSIYQVTVAGLTPLQLVLVGTLLELSVFLFEAPTGVVADVYSRRLSIIIGYLLIGCGFLLEGAIPQFIPILLAQVLWGVGYTFTSGATQAWITDELGASAAGEAAAGRAFLRASQVGQVAALAGIGAGMLLGSWQITLPILSGGALLIGVAVFLILFMPETGFKPTPREDRSSWQQMVHTFRAGLQTVRRRPTLMTIMGIGIFYGLYSEGFDRLWTKLMLDHFTFPAMAAPVVWLGALRVVGLLLSLIATEWARRRVDTASSHRLARFLATITALLVIGMIGFAQAPWLALAVITYLVIYVIRSLIGPLYTAWVNQRLDSSVRATVISLSSQMDAIGQIAGGPLVGLIGNWSVRLAITGSGLLLTPVLALYANTLKRSTAEASARDAVQSDQM